MTAQQIAGSRLSLQDRLVLDEIYRYAVFSENGKVFFGFCEEAIRGIILHRQSKRRLIVHRDQNGEIDGMFAWYRFAEGWEWDAVEKWEEDDESGKELFLAYLFADSPRVLSEMTMRFILKEPDCLHLKLSGIRQKGIQRRPCRVEYSQKLLTRLIKHGRKK